MTSIEHLIGDLLLRHNCVIVPSFGGFVAKQISAKVDFAKGTMLPPRKSLLFNKQLINNDGLLINELAQKLGTSFDDAQRSVNETVTIWNRKLRKGKRIELDRVGMLFLDEENNICFEQDRFFNLLLASFGLGQIHFLTEDDIKLIQTDALSEEIVIQEPIAKIIPLVTRQVIEKEVDETLILAGQVTKKEATPIVAIAAPRKKRKYWRYAAAACILPIAFYSIWIPMRTDVLESGVLSIKDFNPFYKTSDGVYLKTTFTESVNFDKVTSKTLDQEIDEIETNSEVYPFAFTEDTYVLVDIRDRNITTSPIEPVTPEVTEHVAIDMNASHIIVGCFGSKENAENLVAKLKSEGLDALIVDVNNGLHRVSAGAALSDEAVSEIRSKVTSLGFRGWVLK
ncbi:MAG: hypothetical protein ACI837_000681 [Crocinitomicaceae bacterium]|jgi:hypothetical protein